MPNKDSMPQNQIARVRQSVVFRNNNRGGGRRNQRGNGKDRKGGRGKKKDGKNGDNARGTRT